MLSILLSLCASLSHSSVLSPIWGRELRDCAKSSHTSVPGPSRGVLAYTLTPQPVGGPDDQALVAPLFGGENGTMLYTMSTTGPVWALETATGAPLWSYAMVAQAIAGMAISDDGTMLFAADTAGFAVALRAETGAPLWVVPLGNMSFTAPVQNGRLVFFCTSPDGILHALDTATGAVAWTLFTGPIIIAAPSFGSTRNGFSGRCTPVDGCDNMYIPINPTGSMNDTSVAAFNAHTGALLWTLHLSTLNAPQGDILVGGGRLIWANDRGVAAANASTGALLWVVSPNGVPGNAYCSTPTLSPEGDIIYGICFVSGVYALSASTGATRWAFPGALSLVSIVLDGRGALYYADTEGQVVALDAEGGALQWRYNTLLSSPTDLALGWGVLALASGPGTLFVLGEPPTPPPPTPPPPTPPPPFLFKPPFVLLSLVLLLLFAASAVLALLAWRWRKALAAVMPSAAEVLLEGGGRDFTRSIATSTADLQLSEEGPEVPLLPRRAPLPNAAYTDRWATSLPPEEDDFEDAERVFAAEPVGPAEFMVCSGDMGLREGDSWVLTGRGAMMSSARSPALSSPGTESLPATSSGT